MKHMKIAKQIHMELKASCKLSAKRLRRDWRTTPEYKYYMKHIYKKEPPYILVSMDDNTLFIETRNSFHKLSFK